MKKNILSHLSSNKRSGQDRRKQYILKHLLNGRRAGPRRIIDRKNAYYVDRYGRKSLTFLAIVVLLSVTDAFFTLYLVKNGAAEINPVMAFFLYRGPLVFFVIKYFLTSVSVLLLLINKNVFLFKTKYRAEHLFWIIIVLFVLVIFWEIYLVFQVGN
ncbi:MAG: DUF5658 family protein [bacterium]